MAPQPQQSVIHHTTITLLKVADGWEVSTLANYRVRPEREMATIHDDYQSAYRLYMQTVDHHRVEYKAARSRWTAEARERKGKKVSV